MRIHKGGRGINIYPNQISPLIGFRIIEDRNMTDENRVETARTIKERLFTLPWRPFKKTKIIVTYIPKSDIYQIGNTLIMHPETAVKLRSELLK